MEIPDFGRDALLPMRGMDPRAMSSHGRDARATNISLSLRHEFQPQPLLHIRNEFRVRQT